MLNRLVQRIKPYHKYAIGGAWVFVAYSLISLVGAASMSWGGAAGTVSLYQTTANDDIFRSIGLSYTGFLGTVWASIQALVIGAAAALTIIPWRVTNKQRRIGHAVLVGWAAICTLSLLRLAGIGFNIETIAQTAMTTLMLGCTSYRAACNWKTKGTGYFNSAADAMSIDEQEIDSLEETFKPDFLVANDISNSSKLEEIDPPESLDSTDPSEAAKETSSPSLLKQWISTTKSLLGSSFKKAKKPALFVGSKIKAAPGKAKIYLRSHGVLPRPNRSTAA
ncbi:MAG: hypothetical protein IH984_15340 [Planctomycetes bacterium]|nr:hypothetical protein [Planctomycetota bacterium]